MQIIHCRGSHWIVASTMNNCKQDEVIMFDSLYTSIDEDTKAIITNIFQVSDSPRVKYVKTQEQVGTNDCGLFAIATATAIAFGSDPLSLTFNQGEMRRHLYLCFEEGLLIEFP